MGEVIKTQDFFQQMVRASQFGTLAERIAHWCYMFNQTQKQHWISLTHLEILGERVCPSFPNQWYYGLGQLYFWMVLGNPCPFWKRQVVSLWHWRLKLVLSQKPWCGSGSQYQISGWSSNPSCCPCRSRRLVPEELEWNQMYGACPWRDRATSTCAPWRSPHCWGREAESWSQGGHLGREEGKSGPWHKVELQTSKLTVLQNRWELFLTQMRHR